MTVWQIILNFFTNIILIRDVTNLKITSNKYGQQLILIIDATEEITFHAINEVTVVKKTTNEDH